MQRTGQTDHAAHLDHAFEQLIAGMLDRAEAITEANLELNHPNVPGWIHRDPIGERLVREQTHENLRILLANMAAIEFPKTCPDLVVAQIRGIVQMGLGLELITNGFRTGHRAVWEAWSDLVHERIDSEADRRALLDRGSAFLFEYVDGATAIVTEEYQRQREHFLRTREQKQMDAIRQILDGTDLDAASLDWPLDRYHLAVVAEGEDADADIRELAGLLERPLLLLRPMEGWWGWLSGARPLDAAEEAALDGFRPSRGRMTAGMEAPGRTGFVGSHFQATRALWALAASDARWIRFEDVAIEVLAGERTADARAFVNRELRGLDDESTRSQSLRRTLRAYFDADQNAAAAATMLGIHQQTVANRLRAIEELIGNSVASRRVELDTALRLRPVIAEETA